MITYEQWMLIENNIGMWFVMFAVMVALDWIWAKYNQASTTAQPWRASVYAVLIYQLGAAGVMNYTDNKWLLIPAGAGCFVGTFIATSKHKVA